MEGNSTGCKRGVWSVEKHPSRFAFIFGGSYELVAYPTRSGDNAPPGLVQAIRLTLPHSAQAGQTAPTPTPHPLPSPKDTDPSLEVYLSVS